MVVGALLSALVVSSLSLLPQPAAAKVHLIGAVGGRDYAVCYIDPTTADPIDATQCARQQGSSGSVVAQSRSTLFTRHLIPELNVTAIEAVTCSLGDGAAPVQTKQAYPQGLGDSLLWSDRRGLWGVSTNYENTTFSSFDFADTDFPNETHWLRFTPDNMVPVQGCAFMRNDSYSDSFFQLFTHIGDPLGGPFQEMMAGGWEGYPTPVFGLGKIFPAPGYAACCAYGDRAGFTQALLVYFNATSLSWNLGTVFDPAEGYWEIDRLYSLPADFVTVLDAHPGEDMPFVNIHYIEDTDVAWLMASRSYPSPITTLVSMQVASGKVLSAVRSTATAYSSFDIFLT